MNIFSAIVIFVLAWWMAFFCSLPFGIKSAEEDGKGNMPGAPVNPGLKKKLIFATVMAVIIWAVAYFIITSPYFSFHDMALQMRT